MMEYRFVHPRPPAIPKYRAGFVIAAYEGLQLDWLHFITEGLKDAIGNLVDGKKSWAGIAQWLMVLVPPILPIKQWLTVLVPPVLPIKQKKQGRQETTPKKTTKRRQLLEKTYSRMDPRRTRTTGRRAIPTTTGTAGGTGKTGREGEGENDKEDHPRARTG